MEFECGAVVNGSSSSVYFNCYNSGVCSFNSSRGQYCACPSGYTDDLIGFAHFPNCSLPIHALYWFFIAYTVLFYIGLLYSFRKVQTSPSRGKLKTLIILLITWSFTGWIHILCVFVQNGYFEAAIISFIFLDVSGFCLGAYSIQILIEPLGRTYGLVKISTLFIRLTWFFVVLQSLFAIIFSVFLVNVCRQINPSSFNYLDNIFMLEQALAVMIFGIWISISSLKLTKLIPKEAIKVKKQFKWIFIFGLILSCFCLFFAIFIIIWSFFHSFPYMWLVWMLFSFAFLLGVYVSVPVFSLLNAKKSNSNRIIADVKSEAGTGIESPVIRSLRIKGLPSSSKTKKYLTRITERSHEDTNNTQDETINNLSSS